MVMGELSQFLNWRNKWRPAVMFCGGTRRQKVSSHLGLVAPEIMYDLKKSLGNGL